MYKKKMRAGLRPRIRDRKVTLYIAVSNIKKTIFRGVTPVTGVTFWVSG
jgi:hypothetical protein